MEWSRVPGIATPGVGGRSTAGLPTSIVATVPGPAVVRLRAVTMIATATTITTAATTVRAVMVSPSRIAPRTNATIGFT